MAEEIRLNDEERGFAAGRVLIPRARPGARGKIASVNVSFPGGVPKGPIARTTIGRLGLAGDGQRTKPPTHGGTEKAVCLFSLEQIARVNADGHDLYPGASIVVDLGTATTFDVVSDKGEYLGGAISPGVAISLDALYSHAAALRSVELVEPRSVIGRSTVESIQSGVLYGFAAQVDGMVERIWREVGESRVIATGGLAGLIAPRTQHVKFVEPWLTLHGLRIVHERNHAGDHA